MLSCVLSRIALAEHFAVPTQPPFPLSLDEISEADEIPGCFSEAHTRNIGALPPAWVEKTLQKKTRQQALCSPREAARGH